MLGLGGIIGLDGGGSMIRGDGCEFWVIKDSMDFIIGLGCVEGWVGLIIGMVVESLYMAFV